MNNEVKICQNCKHNFTIESEDFDFYKKIDVPPPTWCPECRMKRRMLFRNEFNMYKRTCPVCGRGIISHYSEKVPFPVYCNDCWWSDKWNPLEYGFTYDPKENFFLQWKKFSDVVPRPNLEAYQNENSPYSDFTWFSKNIYLSPSTLASDNVAYSKGAWSCRDTFDSMVTLSCESIYETLDSEHCVNCSFISECKDCLDSSYLFDCRNSSDCFMSSNLRNGKFVFRNKQLTEADYREKMSKLGNDSRTYAELYSEYVALRMNAIHRYANLVRCVNSSGNNLSNCKNAIRCFNSESCEDVKYCVQMSHAKGVQDMYGVGDKEATLLYDGVNVGYLDSNIYFSSNTFENCARAEYCDYCRVSQDLFGCIGLRKKQYCVLNKEYSKEEYEKLVRAIKKDMEKNPYVDSLGRVYSYGEFFPVGFSPFAYNEAMTQFYFPLKKDEALQFGSRWEDPRAREYQPTLDASEVSDPIENIGDQILKEVIGCTHRQACEHHCTLAFKITPQELQFYRKMKIPIPWLCPACRNGERCSLRPPSMLWHRQCMKEGCKNEFETPYAPDRPEIVYCESCYQQEVV